MAGIGGMLAAAILKAAVGKLAAAAGDRIMLQWKFSKDLEDMRDTLMSIEAVLEDAERRSIQEASVRLWLERLTGASYDISDMFDEIEVHTSKKSTLQKFNVLNPLTNAFEIGMASKMKKVREKLESISKQRHEFSFTAGNSSNMQQVIDERETSPEVIEADILGRDQEKQKVIRLLTEAGTSSEFIVLPIYGIGGIGKTTLAQLLFNDTHFMDYEKAWVYVSQTFYLKKIVDSIRSQLQKDQIELNGTCEPNADPPALKKILIVLDDLWENDDFKVDDLKQSLKRVWNGRKVHVIVTTRDAGIAQKIQTMEAYAIEPLSSDICWTIMKQIVSFEDRTDKGQLEDPGKEIAMKCQGVALAARALGYMLRSRNFDGWVSVKENDIWNISKTGYEPSPYDNVLASLKLSYISLLPYVRLCFAYCAVFPKGHEMAKHDLIYQWAALGFIKSSNEISTWQHGENCIKQLLGMSFIRHSKSSSSTRQRHEDVILFTMHDLVHDLARSIMGDILLDASGNCNLAGRSNRYVALADCIEPLGSSFVTYPEKIRALRFVGRSYTELWTAQLTSAKYLRVLDLGECFNLPSSIGKLKLLRYLNAGIIDRMLPNGITKLKKLIYLNLSGSAILTLPESIGEMEDLMYLDLSGCWQIAELPKSFGKLENLVNLNLSNCSQVAGVPKSLENLTQLQYLNLSGCIRLEKLPRSFGKLTNLVHLDLSNSYGVIGVPETLENLTQLQYLNLSGCRLLEEFPRSFGKLTNLVHLDLSNCNCNGVIGVPEALCSLTKLRYLNLSRERRHRKWLLNGYQEPPIGLPIAIQKLTALQYLHLSSCMDYTIEYHTEKYYEEIRDHVRIFLESISTLSNLEHLELSNNKNIRTIPDSFSRLRKLHTLDLTGCYNLYRLPRNMGHMDSLKFLILKDCGNLDISTQRINKNLISLPNFVVHDADGEPSSNLVLLKDLSPPELKLSCLENVKSREEAQRIKLREKQSMVKISLYWTRGKQGYVEDMEVLRELVPPSSLQEFEVRGYNSMSFPTWLGMAVYLPNLVRLKLGGLSQCSSLPSFGQLPKLESLELEAMPRLTKIDIGFCGRGVKTFARLSRLSISYMETLEEWRNMGGINEFTFPSLEFLTISGCRKLMVTPWPIRMKGIWQITGSDSVLLQRGEGPPTSSPSSVGCLRVESCMSPMHQWNLLQNLHSLNELTIINCNDLSSSSDIVLTIINCNDLSSSSDIVRRSHLGSLKKLSLIECRTMTSLPQWLGDLTSLQMLEIMNSLSLNNLPESMRHLNCLRSLSFNNCPGIQLLPDWLGDLVSLKKLDIYFCQDIMYLPESIELAGLERLRILGCPALYNWYKFNKRYMKLRHVKESSLTLGYQHQMYMDYKLNSTPY